MKLAFLAPEFLPTWGGVGTYSVELVRNLCKNNNIEVHVITPKRGKNYDADAVLEFFDNRIALHNISNANDTFFYNFAFQTSLLGNFSSLNKKHKFDLIHAANLVHMPDIFLKFKKIGIPSITTVHTTLRSQSKAANSKNKYSVSAVERLTSLYYPYISLLEKAYLKRTKYLIAVSSWISSFVDAKSNAKELRVIHNGIDVKRFAPRVKDSDEIGIVKDSDKPVILYCGRLMASKGLNVIFESMKELLKKEDMLFVFAGTGDVMHWERQLKGIPKDNYKFLNYVNYEKIHSLYSYADIFVLPSFTESLPLTILEAMSCEVPVISTHVGGIPEIIENNKDGILIEPGNPHQLTKAILRLLDDEQLRRRIAANGRKKVVAKFNSGLMAQKTLQFYKDVLENGN